VEVQVHWTTNPPNETWRHGFAVAVSTSSFPLQFAFSDRKRLCTLDFLTQSDPRDAQRHQFALLSSLFAYLTTSGHLQKQLSQSLKNIRESLGLAELSVSDYLGVAITELATWENGRKSPTGAKMYRWCQALGLVSPPNTALVRVVDFSPALLRFIQEEPERLRALTPDQLEHFVAERLDRMGYKVVLTGATNRKDGGIDLVAVPESGESRVGCYCRPGEAPPQSED
jgi:transcriptional regulator with XRE-family HTH domain